MSFFPDVIRSVGCDLGLYIHLASPPGAGGRHAAGLRRPAWRSAARHRRSAARLGEAPPRLRGRHRTLHLHHPPRRCKTAGMQDQLFGGGSSAKARPTAMRAEGGGKPFSPWPGGSEQGALCLGTLVSKSNHAGGASTPPARGEQARLDGVCRAAGTQHR